MRDKDRANDQQQQQRGSIKFIESQAMKRMFEKVMKRWNEIEGKDWEHIHDFMKDLISEYLKAIIKPYLIGFVKGERDGGKSVGIIPIYETVVEDSGDDGFSEYRIVLSERDGDVLLSYKIRIESRVKTSAYVSRRLEKIRRTTKGIDSCTRLINKLCIIMEQMMRMLSSKSSSSSAITIGGSKVG